MIIIIGGAICATSIYIKKAIHHDAKFYNIQIAGDYLRDEIIIEEYRNSLSGTGGTIYTKVNSILLMNSGETYTADPSYLPIGSGEYIAEYNEDNDYIVFQFKTSEDSEYQTVNIPLP